jgi:HlyD family secretion protein
VRVASARYDAARERFALVNADAREEDRARAEAEIGAARARLDEARAQYDKTFIRSPIAGVILRRLRQPGEGISTLFDSRVVTLANDRVRPPTPSATVAFQVASSVWGGRSAAKNVRTDEPTEKVDTKVLETLVELEDGRELPLGLRVQAFISRR